MWAQLDDAGLNLDNATLEEFVAIDDNVATNDEEYNMQASRGDIVLDSKQDSDEECDIDESPAMAATLTLSQGRTMMQTIQQFVVLSGMNDEHVQAIMKIMNELERKQIEAKKQMTIDCYCR